MELMSRDVGDLRVVTVADARIDAAVAIQFKDQMRALIDTGPDRVVLDLSSVAFVDSSGLGAIVAAMKQAGEPQRLELAGLTRNVAKVFALTRMDRVFTIHADVATLEGLADAG
ncbi:STAS domain-containing protein [Maritimibacter sp. UBA3975]|uniref:STAS domain-containing protein n=1 Tax=Maritimibacter sp. UBA3975 TaxID=1946833 RepID=UPI000C0BB1DC|nr:STAS domain-containing protein [Maritimibacter sp. UBA3975]MAM62483.1 anti-anti-sigma factor [Maritimibacter sp.]